MKSFATLLFCALGVSLLTGCATQRSRQQSLRPDKGQLMRTDEAFAKFAREHGVAEAFREFAAPDATSFPMGESPIHGREAIYQSMLSFPKGELLWTPSAADIARSGDLGYTWGTFEFRTTDTDGKPVFHHGKYLTVWKLQPDGSWKFVADIGNQSPPPQ